LGGRYPDGTRRISIFSILLAAEINIIAPKMNNLPKIVFSKTLEKVKWNKSRLIKDNIADEVSIKQQHGKELVCWGRYSINFHTT
jgi:hypothetical protein